MVPYLPLKNGIQQLFILFTVQVTEQKALGYCDSQTLPLLVSLGMNHLDKKKGRQNVRKGYRERIQKENRERIQKENKIRGGNNTENSL